MRGAVDASDGKLQQTTVLQINSWLEEGDWRAG